MTNHERRLAVLATALAIGLASAGPARAAGWEMRDFESPLGDRAVALTVQAKRQPDVRLGLGCDGDSGARWRGVVVIEEPDSKVGLGMSGDVRVRLGEVSARDLWSVRTTATGRRVYSASESTKLARRLLREEAKSPAAEVTIEIPGIGGKPIPLTFPLAGLAAKIGGLSKRCADWDFEVKE